MLDGGGQGIKVPNTGPTAKPYRYKLQLARQNSPKKTITPTDIKALHNNPANRNLSNYRDHAAAAAAAADRRCCQHHQRGHRKAKPRQTPQNTRVQNKKIIPYLYVKCQMIHLCMGFEGCFSAWTKLVVPLLYFNRSPLPLLPWNAKRSRSK